MTTEHTDYPDDVTEGMAATPCPWCDPHEQTGSDLEAEPLPEWKPLRDRSDNLNKWRLYSSPTRGGLVWFAHQPIQAVGKDRPHFTGQTGTGQYAYMSFSGADALHEFQLAMAKAAA